MPQTRNSNIELLRMLCMLMVTMLHFNHCSNTHFLSFPEIIELGDKWAFFLESFCIVAVNCFVLISGYFGIRLKGKSILKLYLQCLLMGTVAYLLYVWLTLDTLSIKSLMGRLLAFTHNHWWFVVSYLCLMLFSPILNGAVRVLSKKQLLISLILYGVIIFYFGWYKHLENTNSGYSFLSFIFLYLLGRYIGEYVSFDKIRKYRWLSLCGYIFGCLGGFGLIMMHMMHYNMGWSIRYDFAYDHPLIILSACGLFLFFASLNFQNKWVNWCATSVFSAYLLQESPYFGDKVLYPFVGKLIADMEYPKEGMVFVMALAFLVIAVLIDKLFKPISNIVLNLYDKYIFKLKALCKPN